MKRFLFVSLVLALTLAAASMAMAQSTLYCVKPNGAAVAAITMPPGDTHDPSVVCNAVVPQCYLTCTAVLQTQMGGAAANVPTIPVTRQMLQNLGNPAPETPAMCAQQYQRCVAKCRGDRACISYCQSVRSGCGTGNRRGW
ncbi:conserved hypothetical protein [Solidesulfovibrio fructosivorans JJ]]|uniref:Uncharacterized protein n=1 Tax=Solidesulfovibrio fructosivorans JJ] TaxID=596151 RepID=E1JYB3_SOLFR|nr:hypothetical protein [Solidesulfovibrio fructosivorans]EFL50687.1 conserved hypothetical protein [Solidesulfovibrio fructosivorans JJ]]